MFFLLVLFNRILTVLKNEVQNLAIMVENLFSFGKSNLAALLVSSQLTMKKEMRTLWLVKILLISVTFF